MEDNKIINDPQEIAEIFNNFFGNVVKELDIADNVVEFCECDDIEDPILKSIKKYEYHPSILKIKHSTPPDTYFSFSHTNSDAVLNEIQSLSNSTACPTSTIPPKIMKENIDIFSIKLCNDVNIAIDNAIFPTNCKLADITPAHKQNDKLEKNNYRPVSVLSAISKIFERKLYYQIDNFFQNRLSKLQCGFRKGFSAQHCLIVLIEKWKRAMDQKKYAGLLTSDLSKAFDCINHDLIIAKLEAYGFGYSALKLVRSYLRNRFQRVKINSSYSSWIEITSGVPQGSILGPLIFNIAAIDLFLFFNNLAPDVANYADDNTPYVTDYSINRVTERLEKDSVVLLNWIKINYMKANPNKFHLLSEVDNNLSVNVDNCKIFNEGAVKLLGFTIDSKLLFDEHVTNLCNKASQKLHALARVAQYMDIPKKRMIMKAFINSQFGYCPLAWMFHSRLLNNRINKIHERALRIVYGDITSSFEELLNRDNSVTVHERNIQVLAIEVFRVIKGNSPEIMNDIFTLKDQVSYCSKFPFVSNNVRTVAYGTQSLSYLGPKIWSLIPQDMKNLDTVDKFKKQIKLWKPSNCPCRLCKTYVGFLDIGRKTIH